MSEKKNVVGLILICVMAVVGLAVSPSIQSAVDYVTWSNNGTAGFPAGGDNLTGTSKIILELFPLFWVILMIAIPVAYIALWLRS